MSTGTSSTPTAPPALTTPTTELCLLTTLVRLILHYSLLYCLVLGLAWVAIFLVISLEGWTDVMYFVQDAHSFWNWIYFVCLIVVSSRM